MSDANIWFNIVTVCITTFFCVDRYCRCLEEITELRIAVKKPVEWELSDE